MAPGRAGRCGMSWRLARRRGSGCTPDAGPQAFVAKLVPALNPDPLTILLPCLDQTPDYLRQAPDSVLEQTSPSWRLLVLVDRRTPPALVKLIRDKRISVRACRPGFGAALNDGLRFAGSRFVSILLSDDRLTPRAVEVMQEHRARLPLVDFFYSSRRCVGPDGQPVSPDMLAAPCIQLTDFTQSGCRVKHMLCWRRRLALEVGGMDETIGEHGCDDFDFPWTMAQAGAQFSPVPDCLYEYRIHQKGPRLTTGTDIRRQVEILRAVFQKHRAGPTQTADFIHRALKGYLLESHLKSPERDHSYQLGAPRYREWTAQDRPFYGGRLGELFAHRAYFIPKAGPDAYRLARQYFPLADPQQMIEIVLDAQAEEVPVERIPLGLAVTVEFVGPLALAMAGSRKALDVLWALLAGAGILLLGGDLTGGNLTGVLFALSAGFWWVVYILVNRRVGQQMPASVGLTLAMAVAAGLLLPLGAAAAWPAVHHPQLLLLGAAVGLLSSALPYSLEMEALRHLTPSVFGVLMSSEPALAALAGFAVLGQHLTGRQWLAIVLVTIASAGASSKKGTDAPLEVP